MYLIVCLGNPGDDYKSHRHNVGFRVGDTIIKTHGLDKTGKKFKSIIYRGTILGKKIILIKPQTYMNLSGEAIQIAKSFFKIPDSHILVIYDDLDINFSTIRFRASGSAGTHNGMKSVIQVLGTDQFPRIRVGIGPKPEEWATKDFVLSNFSNEEETNLPEIIKVTIGMLEDYVKNQKVMIKTLESK